MSYVRNNLMPNEKILFSAHVHPAVLLSSLSPLTMGTVFLICALGMGRADRPAFGLLAALLLLIAGGAFVCSVLLGIRALIILLTTEFAVTNRRVIAKRGLVRRHTLEILLPKMESISVHQDVLGRLLNFGTVTVTGTGGTKESFRAIARPVEVRRWLIRIVEHYAG